MAPSQITTIKATNIAVLAGSIVNFCIEVTNCFQLDASRALPKHASAKTVARRHRAPINR